MGIIDYIRSDVFYIAFDLLAAVCFLGLIWAKKGRLVFYLFISAILFAKLLIFVGLRPFDAGNDTVHYYYTFQALDGFFSAREVGEQYYGNSEVLYWPFAAFLKDYLGFDFRAFLIFSIFFPILIIAASTRLLIDPVRSMDGRKKAALAMLFTYLVFMSYEVAYFGGHIRSAIGIPLAFMAYVYALRRQVFLSVFMFVLSVCFHNSTVSVVPILAFALFWGNEIKRSARLTACIAAFLIFSFVFGKYYGFGLVMESFGGFYADRYVDYYEYKDFNITSVFLTGYFWIIILCVCVFLVVGYREIHFYAFYYFSLVLLFSATPKISERYFAYILIFLPFLLYDSFKGRVGEKRALLVTCGFSFVTGIMVITSYGVLSTLGIYSFIFSS